jgi:hypothetical protein
MAVFILCRGLRRVSFLKYRTASGEEGVESTHLAPKGEKGKEEWATVALTVLLNVEIKRETPLLVYTDENYEVPAPSKASAPIGISLNDPGALQFAAERIKA